MRYKLLCSAQSWLERLGIFFLFVLLALLVIPFLAFSALQHLINNLNWNVDFASGESFGTLKGS